MYYGMPLDKEVNKMLICLVSLLIFQSNIDYPDPRSFLPLNVGNYWIFGLSNAYDTVEDFMSRDEIFENFNKIIIDRDTIINEKVYYHINKVFPSSTYNENLWLSYDEFGNVIGLDSNFAHNRKVLNFGDLKNAILNGTINENEGLMNSDVGLKSFPFRYYKSRYPVFSYCFSCLEKSFWSCAPVWWNTYTVNSYPGSYYEEVYCPGIGFYSFVFDNSFSDRWKMCLVRAQINGVLYVDIQNTNPTTWLEIKQGK
jgi:hypothetical protein